MALTQITTDGIKDGTITGTDLTTNVDFVDNQKLRLGTGNDLQIYHDSSNGNSHINESGSGSLVIKATNTYINSSSDEAMIAAIADGSVELYHNASKKLETTAAGVKFTGTTSHLNWLQGSNDDKLRFNDGVKATFGNSDDLQIYHTGTNTYLRNLTGELYIQTNDGSGSAENGITVKPNGAVELYHNNTKMAYTSSSGFEVTNGDFRCHLDVKVLNDDRKLFLGGGADLRLFHDGSNSFLTNLSTGGFLHIRSGSGINLQDDTGDENFIKCIDNGAVELYHDNSKKFETKTGGIEVTNANGVTDITSKSTGSNRADVRILATGTGSAYLWMDASNGDLSGADYAFIEHNNATLDLEIGNYANDVIIKNRNGSIGSGGLNTAIHCHENGATELYYDGSNKFETNSAGVKVTGQIEADEVYLRDSEKILLGTGSDLQIYHDGNNSFIENAGVGSLNLYGDEVNILNKARSEFKAKFITDGAVELYYDNSNKFQTTSDGALVSGRLAIGASAANNKINVLGAAGNGQTTLYYGFGTIDLTSASDERVKNNVVSTAKGLDDILKLPIVDFTYKSEYAEDSTTVRTGGIAQEWQKVDPNLVNAENEDLLFIEYKRVIPHLIKAVQELSAEVAALKAG